MYKLNKSKDELTFDEKRALLDAVNTYNGGYEDLTFYENDEEFFDEFFNGNPAEAVRATYFGHYEFTAPLVRFNAYGNLDTCYEYEVEEMIDGYLDDIVRDFAELLSDGYIDDDLDLFEELDDNDNDKHVPF